MTETMREEADRLDEEAAKIEHQGTMALRVLRTHFPELPHLVGVVERYTQETPRELRAKSFELRQRIEQCKHEELLWKHYDKETVLVKCMQCGKTHVGGPVPGLAMGLFASNVYSAFYGEHGALYEDVREELRQRTEWKPWSTVKRDCRLVEVAIVEKGAVVGYTMLSAGGDPPAGVQWFWRKAGPLYVAGG